MLYSARNLKKREINGNDQFLCKQKQVEMTYTDCLNTFVDVNALHVKESPCYKCKQGNQNRSDFSST